MGPKVDFTWTPLGDPISITVGGDTFPPTTQVDGFSRPSDSRYETYETNINTDIEFAATVVSTGSSDIVELRWDLGDGTIAFGDLVNHTYKIANPNIEVSLTVTDNRGRKSAVKHPINLRP
jgi:hypothetical protein